MATLKKSGIIAALIVALSFGPAGAFQLQQFDWGELRDDIATQLREQGKIVDAQSSAEKIVFQDDYLGNARTVTLIFTPQSKQFALLSIEWGDDSLARAALAALTERYGQPNKVNNHLLHYEWDGLFSGDEIVLDARKLTITSGDYYRRYLQEKRSH